VNLGVGKGRTLKSDSRLAFRHQCRVAEDVRQEERFGLAIHRGFAAMLLNERFDVRFGKLPRFPNFHAPHLPAAGITIERIQLDSKQVGHVLG
jgi:hypothetical protein